MVNIAQLVDQSDLFLVREGRQIRDEISLFSIFSIEMFLTEKVVDKSSRQKVSEMFEILGRMLYLLSTLSYFKHVSYKHPTLFR